jgi:hypothetical protein
VFRAAPRQRGLRGSQTDGLSSRMASVQQLALTFSNSMLTSPLAFTVKW